jgi:hypothetical protein
MVVNCFVWNDFNEEDGGNIFLRNVGMCLKYCTVSNPKDPNVNVNRLFEIIPFLHSCTKQYRNISYLSMRSTIGKHQTQYNHVIFEANI